MFHDNATKQSANRYEINKKRIAEVLESKSQTQLWDKNKHFAEVLESKSQTLLWYRNKLFAEVLESKSQIRFQNPFLLIVSQPD